MTKLWITAKTPDEVKIARASGADIVSLPTDSDDVEIDFIADSTVQKKRMVICKWSPIFKQGTKQFSTWREGGFDGVMLEQFPKSVTRFSDKNCGKNKKIEQSGEPSEPKTSLEANGHLLSDASLAELADFIKKAHESGLMVALSGALEPPDIPRLLRLSPDMLCFARDEKAANAYFSQPALRQMIRSLIPHEGEEEEHGNIANCATDRLIVRNFILPVEIGAYQHERGHKQHVRFNVFADVALLSNNPQDMRHIVSYDLIMDAIRQLVAQGHVDLVETLAEDIASSVLEHEAVRRVIVRVEKLDLEPEAVGIEIERHKS